MSANKILKNCDKQQGQAQQNKIQGKITKKWTQLYKPCKPYTRKYLSKEKSLAIKLFNITRRTSVCDQRNLELFKTKRNTFLRPDVYCKQLGLVVEYNGPLHYDYAQVNVTERDIEKREICRANNIHLVIVPMNIYDSLFSKFLYFSLVVSQLYDDLEKVEEPINRHIIDPQRILLCLIDDCRKYLEIPKSTIFVIKETNYSNPKYYEYVLKLEDYKENVHQKFLLPFKTVKVVCWCNVPVDKQIPVADIHIPLYLFRTTKVFSQYFASYLLDHYDVITRHWKLRHCVCRRQTTKLTTQYNFVNGEIKV